jgi:hypothetical protein
MVWLAWRQHRLQAAIGGLALALLVAGLLATRRTVDGYARAAATCATPLSCAQARDALAHYAGTMPLLQYVLPALPLLVGVFAGAPLVAREVEQGTHVLVWTQSITPRRWLAGQLSLLGGLTLPALGVLVALVTWWSSPIDAAIGPWTTFDVRGAAPLAYALFALLLGIAAGMAVRNTVAAMALTLALFVVTRLAVVSALRPRFRPPLTAIEPFRLGPGLAARDWVLSLYPVDHLGHPLRQYMQIAGACEAVPRSSYAACMSDRGVFVRAIYQPAGRFWLFQGIETAIFLGLAGLLLVLAVWWITQPAPTALDLMTAGAGEGAQARGLFTAARR